MDVTYEWSEVSTQNLHYRVCHELRNGLLGSYSICSLSSPQTKSKSMKKHRSRTTASTSHEFAAITYNSFGPLQSNNNFELLLLGRIIWYSGFNRWPLPSPRTMRVKNFFQNMQLFTQCISMLYTEKSVLCYYVRFSQIRSQFVHLPTCSLSWYLLLCVIKKTDLVRKDGS